MRTCYSCIVVNKSNTKYWEIHSYTPSSLLLLMHVVNVAKEGEKMLFNNHSKKGREPKNKEIEVHAPERKGM